MADFNVEFWANVARLLVIPVFIYLSHFFISGYKKSKEAGFANKFYLGFYLMFLLLSFYQIGSTVYGFLQWLYPENVNLIEQPFPNANFYKDGVVWIYWNLVHLPAYILGITAITLLFAAQIYPVEIIVKWERAPLSKILILLSILLMLEFIEPIRWSLYTPIVLTAWVLALSLTLFLNLGVNFKLALQTTGEVKKRSIRIILAFLLFFGGFIWALEVGWTDNIVFWMDVPNDYQWDIIIGSIIEVLGGFLYRSGFVSAKEI